MLPVILNNKMHRWLDFMRCTWRQEILFCTIQLVEFIGCFGMNRHLQEKNMPLHNLVPFTDSQDFKTPKPRSYSENWAQQHFEGLRNQTYPPWSIQNAWPKQKGQFVSDLQNYRFWGPMTPVRTYITQGPVVPNLEWFDNPVEGLALVSKLHTAKLQKQVTGWYVSNTTEEACCPMISEKDWRQHTSSSNAIPISLFLISFRYFRLANLRNQQGHLWVASLCPDVTTLLQIWYFSFRTVRLAKVVATAPEKSATQRYSTCVDSTSRRHCKSEIDFNQSQRPHSATWRKSLMLSWY